MKIGLIADIHSNIEALRVVQADGEARGVKGWWCAGDVIGYGPRPVETVRLFKEMMALPDSAWVIGNNDAIWLNLVSSSTARRSAVKAQQLNGDALEGDAELCDWFRSEASQPERRHCSRQHLGETDCVLGHTYDPGLSSYVKPVGDEYIVRAYVLPLLKTHLPAAERRLFLFGHTHYATFYRVQGEQVKAVYVEHDTPYQLLDSPIAIINPGGLGQSRDGDARAAYAVLDDENQTITFYRLPYCTARVVDDLYDLGYPIDLIEQMRDASMAWENLEKEYIQHLKRRAAPGKDIKYAS